MQMDGSTLSMPTYLIFLFAPFILPESSPNDISPFFHLSFANLYCIRGFFPFQQHLHVELRYTLSIYAHIRQSCWFGTGLSAKYPSCRYLSVSLLKWWKCAVGHRQSLRSRDRNSFTSLHNLENLRAPRSYGFLTQFSTESDKLRPNLRIICSPPFSFSDETTSTVGL